MGSGYKCRCSKCNKEFEFIEGIGMFDSSFNLMDYNSDFNLLKRYENGLYKSDLKKILKQKQHVLQEDYGYKTYQCPSCKEISNEFYFKLEPSNKNKKEFISEYKCNKCNKKIEVLNDIEKCPICGGEFDRDNIILIRWD